MPRIVPDVGEDAVLELLGLGAKLLAGEVDVPYVVLTSECPARTISAASELPAAASFVSEVCPAVVEGLLLLSGRLSR